MILDLQLTQTIVSLNCSSDQRHNQALCSPSNNRIALRNPSPERIFSQCILREPVVHSLKECKQMCYTLVLTLIAMNLVCPPTCPQYLRKIILRFQGIRKRLRSNTFQEHLLICGIEYHQLHIHIAVVTLMKANSLICHQ